MPSSTQRLQQIAAMYPQHDPALHRVVHRRGSQNPVIVDDACAHAWTQLLAAEHVELCPPRWRALAWLTTTAVRHAWLLNETQRRMTPRPLDAIDALAIDRGQTAPAADHVAAQRIRLDLVAQIPERPRRFLLRLAMGHSYAEIAAAENASHTTTRKQIARAKRLLRDLEQSTTTGR